MMMILPTPSTRLLPLAGLLLVQQCRAFVVPSALGGWVPGRDAQLGILRASSMSQQQAPKMVLSGLPSPTTTRKKLISTDTCSDATPPRKKYESQINDDFPTTVGRAAFSSLKDKARDMMVKGAEKRGLDWTGIVERLQVCLISERTWREKSTTSGSSLV